MAISMIFMSPSSVIMSVDSTLSIANSINYYSAIKMASIGQDNRFAYMYSGSTNLLGLHILHLLEEYDLLMKSDYRFPYQKDIAEGFAQFLTEKRALLDLSHKLLENCLLEITSILLQSESDFFFLDEIMQNKILKKRLISTKNNSNNIKSRISKISLDDIKVKEKSRLFNLFQFKIGETVYDHLMDLVFASDLETFESVVVRFTGYYKDSMYPILSELTLYGFINNQLVYSLNHITTNQQNQFKLLIYNNNKFIERFLLSSDRMTTSSITDLYLTVLKSYFKTNNMSELIKPIITMSKLREQLLLQSEFFLSDNEQEFINILKLLPKQELLTFVNSLFNVVSNFSNFDFDGYLNNRMRYPRWVIGYITKYNGFKYYDNGVVL